MAIARYLNKVHWKPYAQWSRLASQGWLIRSDFPDFIDIDCASGNPDHYVIIALDGEFNTNVDSGRNTREFRLMDAALKSLRKQIVLRRRWNYNSLVREFERLHPNAKVED